MDGELWLGRTWRTMVRIVDKHSVMGPGSNHSACANALHSLGVACQHGQEVGGVHVGVLVVHLETMVHIVTAWAVVDLHATSDWHIT